MIHFTPEQYAIFVGGVRYIKKAIKKKGKRRSTRNRKQKKGTRRRQKGGNGKLRFLITALLLAALFSAYLINAGTDMSLQTGIVAFSNAANLGVNAEDINNFMEGLAIMIFYAGVDWNADGQSRPNTCEQGQWAPYVPGYGRITSLASDPVPGWADDCPRNAHILGTVLTSVLAGMFIAWIGPCVMDELVDATIGPAPALPEQSQASTKSNGNDSATAILAQALAAVTVDPNDPLLRITLPRKQKPKRTLTPQQKQQMERRSEARRMACAAHFANPPLSSDISISRNVGITMSPGVRRVLQNARQIPPGATSEDVRAMSQGLGPTPTAMTALTTRGRRTRGLPSIQEEPSAPLTTTSQQLVPSSLQEESRGNTLITLPEGVMAELRQSGDLAKILTMVNNAAIQITNQDQFQQKVAIMEGTILEIKGPRLQLQDGIPKLNCNTPLPSGSCPSIPRPLPLPKDGPEIEELDNLSAGGAKRRRRRRVKKKNTKKKRPRNKKKSRKRR